MRGIPQCVVLDPDGKVRHVEPPFNTMVMIMYLYVFMHVLQLIRGVMLVSVPP